MNQTPEHPPPDWEAVFQQARRRMAMKLLVVASLAAVGTMLLLGGGLRAQGAVSFPIPGVNEKQSKHEQKSTHHHHQSQEQGQPQKSDEGGPHQPHKPKNGNDDGNKTEHHPKHCVEKKPTSAESEYGDWEWPNGAAGEKCPSNGS